MTQHPVDPREDGALGHEPEDQTMLLTSLTRTHAKKPEAELILEVLAKHASAFAAFRVDQRTDDPLGLGLLGQMYANRTATELAAGFQLTDGAEQIEWGPILAAQRDQQWPANIITTLGLGLASAAM